MIEELKPCPFCGGKASRSTEKATMLRSPLRVSCSDDGCGAHYGAWHPKEWNTRAELAALKAGQGEAVEVVAHLVLGGIFDDREYGDIDYQIEPDVAERLQQQNVKTADDVQLELMTVAQHERILAVINAPPGTGVIVRRELLETLLIGHLGIGHKAAKQELRALLAQDQGVKS